MLPWWGSQEPEKDKTMKSRAEAGRGWRWLVVLALLLFGPIGLWAEEVEMGAPAVRLSFATGAVQITVGGQVVVDQAVTNLPVSEGAAIVTGQDGQAEIQLEDGSIARITPNSTLQLSALRGASGADLDLVRGLGYFELQNGQSSIGFGASHVSVSGFTVLRIRMDEQPGELAVFTGQAQLDYGRQLQMTLQAGESVALNPMNPGRSFLAESIESDSWDGWNSDRDQALNQELAGQTQASASYQDSGAPSPAWADLDANGSWYNVPGQGYVWTPYAASDPGWQPYGCGRWVWTPQSGYVWVSCESWGFLPYMCGGWNYYDGFGWGWSPAYGCGRGQHWGSGYFTSVRIHNGPRGFDPIRRPLPGPRQPNGLGPRQIFVGRPIPPSAQRPHFDHRDQAVIGGVSVHALPPERRDAPVAGGGNGFWGRGRGQDTRPDQRQDQNRQTPQGGKPDPGWHSDPGMRPQPGGGRTNQNQPPDQNRQTPQGGRPDPGWHSDPGMRPQPGGGRTNQNPSPDQNRQMPQGGRPSAPGNSSPAPSAPPATGPANPPAQGHPGAEFGVGRAVGLPQSPANSNVPAQRQTPAGSQSQPGAQQNAPAQNQMRQGFTPQPQRMQQPAAQPSAQPQPQRGPQPAAQPQFSPQHNSAPMPQSQPGHAAAPAPAAHAGGGAAAAHPSGGGNAPAAPNTHK